MRVCVSVYVMGRKAKDMGDKLVCWKVTESHACVVYMMHCRLSDIIVKLCSVMLFLEVDFVRLLQFSVGHDNLSCIILPKRKAKSAQVT